MTDYRLTFDFPGMNKRTFIALAQEIYDFVLKDAKHLPRGLDYSVFASPEGPPEWEVTDVEVKLHGIRADRARSAGA